MERAAARLFASDLHAGALGTARRNARRAGIEADLTLSRTDVARFERPPGLLPGLWLSNLPYGIRVGERSELASLYRSVAATWRRALPDWRAGFLVEDAALLEEAFGRPAAERFAVSNGGIRCSLLVWHP